MTTYNANNYTIKIVQGDDWTFDFQLTVDVNGVETPVDVTGYTIAGVVKKTRSSPTAEATMSWSIQNAAQGRIRVGLTDTQTSILPLGSLYYEIRRTVSGDTLTLFSGPFMVR